MYEVKTKSVGLTVRCTVLEALLYVRGDGTELKQCLDVQK